MNCRNCRGCVSLKEYKSQGKAADMTVNSKEEDYSDFCLDFVQEFGHWKLYLTGLAGEGVEGAANSSGKG
jgi:hypothetical protein